MKPTWSQTLVRKNSWTGLLNMITAAMMAVRPSWQDSTPYTCEKGTRASKGLLGSTGVVAHLACCSGDAGKALEGVAEQGAGAGGRTLRTKPQRSTLSVAEMPGYSPPSMSPPYP